MLEQARAELAPTGVLRAGINMSNFLLVTGKTPEDDPDGVSPDMARAVADRLGVAVKLVPFKTPGERILEGSFTAVQQAIGTKPDRQAGAAFLREFVEEAKASGLVASLIEKHRVTGRLTVAPPA
jgi:polar amino acid transport system substrate-binding protein